MEQDIKLEILYVEDDKNLREEYQKFFSKRCDTLFLAFNGQEGFDSFLKNKPDIIITDITMPIMNGLEMIKKIREVDTSVPIIVTSAFNEQEYLLEAINQGVTRYILKPFNRKLLKQLVEETITFVNLKKRDEYYKNIIQEYHEIIDHNVISSRTNLDGIITYVSKAFCQVCGYSEEELLGKTHNILYHPDVSEPFCNELWETISKDNTWKGEIKNRTKDGQDYWIQATISPIYNKEGKKIAYSSIRENITAKKKLEELSIKDSLTNIYNRRYFNEKIVELLNTCKRGNESICLLIIDIDYFKLYNDTYGHQEGDKVLIKVSNSLNSSMQRATDYCFRIGGEEFAILFITEKPDNSISFSNQIREKVENLKIEHSKNTVSKFVTISAGLYCEQANKIKNDMELFKKADDLLYQAKESGRNKVVSN
ncbi:MAG: diguanylate cyclase [Halarcobacter sp.]